MSSFHGVLVSSHTAVAKRSCTTIVYASGSEYRNACMGFEDLGSRTGLREVGHLRGIAKPVVCGHASHS